MEGSNGRGKFGISLHCLSAFNSMVEIRILDTDTDSEADTDTVDTGDN